MTATPLNAILTALDFKPGDPLRVQLGNGDVFEGRLSSTAEVTTGEGALAVALLLMLNDDGEMTALNWQHVAAVTRRDAAP